MLCLFLYKRSNGNCVTAAPILIDIRICYNERLAENTCRRLAFVCAVNTLNITFDPVILKIIKKSLESSKINNSYL